MTLIILFVLTVIVAAIMLNAQNNAYKSSGKDQDRLSPKMIILWIVAALVFVFGCFGNLIGACGGDLSKIGGR
jgi:DMSO reductase anchor subunit